MQGEFNMRFIHIIHHANKSKGEVIWNKYTEKAFDKIQIFTKFAKLWIKKKKLKIQESMEILAFLACSSWRQSTLTPSGQDKSIYGRIHCMQVTSQLGLGDLGRVWASAVLGNTGQLQNITPTDSMYNAKVKEKHTFTVDKSG